MKFQEFLVGLGNEQFLRFSENFEKKILSEFDKAGFTAFVPNTTVSSPVLISTWSGITNTFELEGIVVQLPERAKLIFALEKGELAEAQAIYGRLNPGDQSRVKLVELKEDEDLAVLVRSIHVAPESSRQLLLPHELVGTRFVVPVIGAGAELLKKGYALVVVAPQDLAVNNIERKTVSMTWLNELISISHREQRATEERLRSA